ncbi:MAG: hypothetical protein AAF127_16425 [Pseudomonadota bacterium]
MIRSNNPVLSVLLLAALALRMVCGAPCCWEPNAAHGPTEAASHHGHHGHHGHAMAASVTHQSPDLADNSGHPAQHSDNTANPCCSACGPTLPPEPLQLARVAVEGIMPGAAPVRELATRPPFPAYDARGPPSAV